MYFIYQFDSCLYESGLYRSRGGHAIRQQVKAALDLIGVEYAGDTLTGGKVEYKLRQISSQNKRLKFGTQPQHIRFEEESGAEEEVVVKPQKRRKRKKKLISYPPEMETNKRIKKFWSRRFSLFSKFDEGIQLDEGKQTYDITTNNAL